MWDDVMRNRESPTHQQKPPLMAGVLCAHREPAQADFFFGAAFFTATGLVTVGLAPTTACTAVCARVLP